MTLTSIIGVFTNLALTTVPILVALTLLFFFWGLATFILNTADTDKNKEGKQRMIWGLVALFFILSIGGVLAVLQDTFFGSGLNYQPQQQTQHAQQVVGGQGSVRVPVESNEPAVGWFRARWNTIFGGGSTEVGI